MGYTKIGDTHQFSFIQFMNELEIMSQPFLSLGLMLFPQNLISLFNSKTTSIGEVERFNQHSVFKVKNLKASHVSNDFALKVVIKIL